MSNPLSRGKPLAGPPSDCDDVAQRPVVHVEHAPPHDPPHVDVERIAPMDMIVDHRREQIVRAGDRVEIAGEMEVDVLHRHDLRIAARRSRRPWCRSTGPSDGSRSASIALRPIRLSASASPTEVVVLPSPAGVGLIAVTRISLPWLGRRGSRGEIDLRLVTAIGLDRRLGEPEAGGDVGDGQQRRGARNFDVGLHRPPIASASIVRSVFSRWPTRGRYGFATTAKSVSGVTKISSSCGSPGGAGDDWGRPRMTNATAAVSVLLARSSER